MKTLRSLEEVESAGLSPPVHAAVHGVLKNLIDAYAEWWQSIPLRAGIAHAPGWYARRRK
jgi:hypothetical protein